MPQQTAFAYSLSQVDDGWRWTVYDEDGVTVADGEDSSRDGAEAAVASTLRSAPGEARSFG